jgi:hypothetical protein
MNDLEDRINGLKVALEKRAHLAETAHSLSGNEHAKEYLRGRRDAYVAIAMDIEDLIDSYHRFIVDSFIGKEQ